MGTNRRNVRGFIFGVFLALAGTAPGGLSTSAGAGSAAAQGVDKNTKDSGVEASDDAIKKRYIVILKKAKYGKAALRRVEASVAARGGFLKRRLGQRTRSIVVEGLGAEGRAGLIDNPEVEAVVEDKRLSIQSTPKRRVVDMGRGRVGAKEESKENGAFSFDKAGLSQGGEGADTNEKAMGIFASPDSERESAQVIPVGIRRIRSNLKQRESGLETRPVNVDVAIIDSGVDPSHPDLNVHFSYNFVTNQATASDDNGHGTHVAGTIGARDDGFGVVGVAPGARVWDLRVLDASGHGYNSDIIEALEFVIDRKDEIEVVNMSLGGEPYGSEGTSCGQSLEETGYTDVVFDFSCFCFKNKWVSTGIAWITKDPLHEAICRVTAAGVIVVAAAGNEDTDIANSIPGKYPEVIGVSAVEDSDGIPGAEGPTLWLGDDRLAAFSNYGAGVDIAAPGVEVLSTYTSLKTGVSGHPGYAVLNGTSMASPHVAGAAALYTLRFGKPKTAAEVSSVRTYLRTKGFSYSSEGGFSGDKDNYPEPLLNIETLPLRRK